MAQWACSLRLAVVLVAIGAIAVGLAEAMGQSRRDEVRLADKKSALKPGQIDLEKSRVYIRVGKKGLGHEHGVEGKIKAGSIDLDAKKDLGEIEFDITSFQADTDEARTYVDLDGTIAESTRDKVTETMLGPSVLDIEHFQKATFKIKSAEMFFGRVGGPFYRLKGDFTLHGKTRPLTIQVQVEAEDGQRRLRGEFKILQSDFGITPYKAALGTVGVADELKIWGDIWIIGEEVQKKK